MDYLKREYGDFVNWIIPKRKNYKWSNLETKNTLWSESEWPYAIKFFYMNGTFNYNATLSYIQSNLSRNITSLPADVLKRFQ
jgi:glucan biosynthesis protein